MVISLPKVEKLQNGAILTMTSRVDTSRVASLVSSQELRFPCSPRYGSGLFTTSDTNSGLPVAHKVR